MYECDACGHNHMAYKKPTHCDECGPDAYRPQFIVKQYEEGMPILGGLCPACEKELEEHAEVVKQGGVYWKCVDCPAEGVIRGTSDFAKAVRATHGIAAPEPCGVRFEAGIEPLCPMCGGTGNQKKQA